MRRQNSRRPWRASNAAGVIPSSALAPASKSASTPSASRNRRGRGSGMSEAGGLERHRDRRLDVLPAAVAKHIVALARLAPRAQRPGDMVGRAVGPVGGAVELDDQAFEAVLVIRPADDARV